MFYLTFGDLLSFGVGCGAIGFVSGLFYMLMAVDVSLKAGR